MRRRMRLLAAGAAAAAVLAMTACTAGGPTPGATFRASASGELVAWGFNDADDVGTARLRYAAHALHGVRITLDQTDFDASKFVTRIASNTVPDVVQMDASSVDTYAAQGLILPLDACYAAHHVDPRTRFYPQVAGTVEYHGHVWAVPQFYQPPAILLNTRVLKAAGVRASAFDTSKPAVLLAAIRKLYRARNGQPSVIGFDPQATGNAQLWMLGMGGRIVDAKGAPQLQNAGNRRALALLKRIYDAQGGYAKVKSYTDSFDEFGDGNQFVKDQVAAQVQPQWYVNVLTATIKKVALAAVPFRDAAGQPYTTAGATSFVIPAGAKHLDAACAWALDLTSPAAWEAAGAARAATLRKTPGAVNTGLFTGSPAADAAVRKEYVRDTEQAGFGQVIGTYYAILPKGKSFGTSPAGAQVAQDVTDAMTSVLLGEQSPQAALATAQQKAEIAYRQVTENE